MKLGYPNIIIPLIGGYISDMLGDRVQLIIANVIITVGWLIVYYGVLVEK